MSENGSNKVAREGMGPTRGVIFAISSAPVSAMSRGGDTSKDTALNTQVGETFDGALVLSNFATVSDRQSVGDQATSATIR